MTISDLEEDSVEILKDAISVLAFGPTVQHILPGVKYFFYFQNQYLLLFKQRGDFR